jgi:hypothetical protein
MTRVIHACQKCDKPIVCKSATRRPDAQPCKQKPPFICAECAGKSQ